MTDVLGDFLPAADGVEHLCVRFSKTSLAIKERWRNNGLTADFIAAYAETFLPPSDAADPRARKFVRETKDSLSFVANELLENGLKYHEGTAGNDIELRFEVRDAQRLVVQQTNLAGSERVNALRVLAHEILTRDVSELYFEKLERSNGDSAGLGLITIVNDHGATLAWQFAPHPSGLIAVTTQASLAISQTAR
jgi:hypothetical protein